MPGELVLDAAIAAVREEGTRLMLAKFESCSDEGVAAGDLIGGN